MKTSVRSDEETLRHTAQYFHHFSSSIFVWGLIGALLRHLVAVLYLYFPWKENNPHKLFNIDESKVAIIEEDEHAQLLKFSFAVCLVKVKVYLQT